MPLIRLPNKPLAGSISSTQAAIARKKTVHQLGLPVAVLSDNSSENFGAFAEPVNEQDITRHVRIRPKTSPILSDSSAV